MVKHTTNLSTIQILPHHNSRSYNFNKLMYKLPEDDAEAQKHAGAFVIILYSIYTGCPRRNVPDFGRVFLMLKYTDITQNTYIQS